MKLRTLLLSFLVVVGFCACKQQLQKEVILKTEDGNPKLVYHVAEKDGKKERVKEELFYDNGKVQYVGEFKDEKPFGKWKFYFEDGKLFAEGIFEGSEYGKDWKFYRNDGKQLHPKGVPEIQAFSNMNAPTMVSFKEGDEQYEYLFYPDFKTKALGKTINGKREGKWTYWFQNGNKWTEAEFVDGLQHGEQTVYHENGQTYYKGNLENGIRVGEWSFFDEGGVLFKKETF